MKALSERSESFIYIARRVIAAGINKRSGAVCETFKGICVARIKSSDDAESRP